ncbi:ATPase family AAA domain-containing protein 5 [Cheilinus undulatus]|uniref:ATPase family AAA domain-containing protein 5 n=1 Tax=Cheilinus undulatus TaxID=241271 RepID=UPI001BD27EC3|nr:ATPase family AAA domain-containing protein 5 [Cheilinus undulatus]
MAGVVAMASVIEDFDTQPCKKSRKDASSPVVKTITNYFSPVPKPAEKPFSPPRSNNIMDYFNRKAPSSKDRNSSPEQSKENVQTCQPAVREAAVKHQPQKRSRKASKAARKLVEVETVSSASEDSCVNVEEQHDSRDSAAGVISSCGVLGSDTAALLVQLSAEACMSAESSENDTKDEGLEQADKGENSVADGSKQKENIKLKPELKCIELSPIVPHKEKAKQVKSAARNSRKRLQQEEKDSKEEEKEKESSLCDVSMEVNVDEASQLNSTVTISFEDFVRSQSQENEQGKYDDCKIISEAEEMDTEQIETPKADENVSSSEPPLQVSPRTLTIQAEVHAVSPKQDPAKVGGRVASIFNRRKGATSPAESKSSSQTEAEKQLPSPAVKRKSNVVLQEEDLELSVLESESMPKCSDAERKQFMAAFKQPCLDGSKAKPAKSKQKPAEEKVVEEVEKVTEEEGEKTESKEQEPAASEGNKAAKKKPVRKGRKKGEEEKEAAKSQPPAPVEETVTATLDDQKKEPHMTSTPSIPAVRRSRRESAARQTPETAPTTPVRKLRKHNESKDAAVAVLPDDSPADVSTPKRRRSKHGVFVAEMLGPSDTKGSPIRIKFRRVQKNVSIPKAEGNGGKNPPVAAKVSAESKKRKQAKKLVEKAKVIQQSKKGADKEKDTLRRSSRTEASLKKSYCEDEDSVICLEEDQTKTAPEKRKTQKSLRSLNDVLGKAKPGSQDSKATPAGSKVPSLAQEKSSRKASAVISIFDDSSRDGSDCTQDDEQFRARREFLKSGLPESFRKQIAKTAASKEAYSLSCSSFQPVVHVKQQQHDSPLWSLPWPESSLLHHLKELWSQTFIPPQPVSGSLCMKTKPVCRALCERGSGWRPEISESVRQLLMEEVRTSNPAFPIQVFLSRLLKRCIDHQQQQNGATEPEAVSRESSTAGGKRKRTDDEEGMTVKVAKKQKANSSEEISAPETTTRGGRKRRGQRLVKAAPVQPEDDSVVVLDDVSGGDTERKDLLKEDVLWTDKYQPQHSCDIVGNLASVRRLHSWLKEWKIRADREEKKKQKEKKEEEGSNDSDWDCGEDDSQDGEDMLCNTMLITGPTGVGKTAAVYACAQELGFKVFEVNASSQRSGRLILSQLKEATQSHQVDSQGVNAHKPSYFNSYGTSSSAGTMRPGSSPRKINSPRRVVSSPRKHPQSPRGAKRGNLAPTSLANFFKMGRPTNKDAPNTKKNEQTDASQKDTKANDSASKHKGSAVKSPATTPKDKANEEQNKKTATSLILFEEVDVIFDDDSGFIAAIKTFMTTTKRPVILTTSDPAFSAMFDGCFEETLFKTPSVADASSFLRLLCLTEDVRMDQSDVSSLLRVNGGDVRQSLLQLQFWSRSGGGCKVAQTDRSGADQKPRRKSAEILPLCDSGCTESMLSLLNTKPERNIWELLKSRSLLEEEICLDLLMNSQRRGVDLLYSNMEALLPLPRTQLTTSNYNQKPPVSASQDCPTDLAPAHARLLETESADCSDDGSPVKISNRMKKNKRRHCLPEKGRLDSDSDSEGGFLSLNKPQEAPAATEDTTQNSEPEKVKRMPVTPEERAKSVPVSKCLESMADFLDNISYMDSSMLVQSDGGQKRSHDGAAVKDGMTDEPRIETERESRMRGELMFEISATVEALSFHRLRVSAEEVWQNTQQLEGEVWKEAAAELSLPVAAHREGYSFTQDGLCQPQIVQQRREVMESLMVRGVFGSLCNRPAAALDFLPALRTICRSEQLKEQGKVKRRFLHYLDAINLGIEKNTLQHLAEDFP